MNSTSTNNQNDAGRGAMQVIARAAAVLRALEGQKDGLSLGAIAKAIDLPRSTVQRLVGALEIEGMLEAGPGGVRLGPAILRLASGVNSDLVTLARPHLQRLAEACDETVCLIQAKGTTLGIVHAVISNQELRVAPLPDHLLQMHATSAGKALLAGLPDETIDNLLPDPLPRLTAHTLSSRAALHRELAKVREEGFAYDWQEHVQGVCAIGTALYAGGAAYSVCILAPTFRFEPALERLREALLECRQAIERSCGL
ncbi:IclR family transcriptional regulator [Stutzerimonas marianensis]